MTWTTERVAEATRHWLAGHSAAEVARMIGGVSRNAVIGKMHRLGLCSAERAVTTQRLAGSITGRAPTVKRNTKADTANARGFVVRNAGKSKPPMRLDGATAFHTPIPGSTPRPWEERQGCAFPLTIDGVEGFSCCEPRMDAADPVRRNYCRHHAALMFQPGKKKPRGDVLAADARHDALRSLRRSGHVRAA